MRLATFLPIFFVFIVIFFGVMMGAVAKSEKKKKAQNNSRAQNMRARLDGNTSENLSSEPFVFDEVTFSEKKPAPVRKYVKPVSDQPRSQQNVRQVEGTDLFETKSKVHTSAQVVGIARSHHDEHCDVDSHEDEDVYLVEKVPVSGSIGGTSDEGCGEHYNLRYIKLDDEEQSSVKFELTQEAIRRAIILGEIINDPAYKK